MSQDEVSRQGLRERLSALLDGEDEFRERGSPAAAFVRAAAADADLRRDWLLYAQIGDVLRSGDLAPLPQETRFLERVCTAVAQEPIVIAPAARPAAAVATARRRPHWTTRVAAGMAAVGGVAVMAWVALPNLHESAAPAAGGGAIVASAVAVAPQPAAALATRAGVEAAAPVDAALVQTRLDASPARTAANAVVVPVAADMPMVEYLLAHQQLAGGMMPVVPATLRIADPQAAAH